MSLEVGGNARRYVITGISLSDVNNNNAVGPSSLTVRPTVYFVQGPQHLWALESQLRGSRTGLPGQAQPVLGSGSVLGIPLGLD